MEVGGKSDDSGEFYSSMAAVNWLSFHYEMEDPDELISFICQKQ